MKRQMMYLINVMANAIFLGYQTTYLINELRLSTPLPYHRPWSIRSSSASSTPALYNYLLPFL
jgi:hypothetical protein